MQNFTPPRPPTASRSSGPNTNPYSYNSYSSYGNYPNGAPPLPPELQTQASGPNGTTRRDATPPPRRTSFSFLRRARSTDPEPSNERKVSSGKMSRKQKAREREEQLRREREAAAIPRQPPRLPHPSPLPVINTFGGEGARPDSVAIISNQTGGASNPQNLAVRSNMHGSSPQSKVPIPPVPTTPGQGYVDPYARTESMTHRSRYSYASSAVSNFNSPRRVRRRKDPAPFK